MEDFAKGYDRMDVTIAGQRVGDGVASLSAGVSTVNGVRDLLHEAARSAGQALELPPNTVTMTADAFLSLVELSAEAGSFVWRFRIPVEGPPMPLRVVQERPGPPPYGRLVTLTAASWLVELRDVVLERSDDPRLVTAGSPETTRAVLKTLIPAAQGGELQFTFAWSSHPGLEPRGSQRIHFSETHIPLLVRRAEAEEEGQLVREGVPHRTGVASAAPAVEEHESFTLIGRVEALRRPEITVVGDVFGRDRRVRLTLPAGDYARAAVAHVSYATVVVVGTLLLTPRSARMWSVEGFDVLESED